MPFSQNAGMKENVDELIEVLHEAEHAVEEKLRLVRRAAGFFPPLGVPVSSGRLFILTCHVGSHATPTRN